MKRRDLLKFLRSHGCYLYREGGRHSLFCNEKTGDVTTVPRHKEINPNTVKSICKDLNIFKPDNCC